MYMYTKEERGRVRFGVKVGVESLNHGLFLVSGCTRRMEARGRDERGKGQG